MGRHSDSDDDRKKRKKKKKKRSRSRSRSGSIESRHSTKHKHSKKSKRSNRSRSRSRESHRSRKRSWSRSRSRSYDRRSRSRSYSRRSRSRSYSRRSRSRSRSRDKHYRRSRSKSRSRRSSPSYSRRSRSRSRERYRKRNRSRDRSRERSRRSHSHSPLLKDIKQEKIDKKEDPCANIPGFSEMTPAEQASIRMKIALKAAAAADDKLKDAPDGGRGAKSFEEQYKFSQAIQDIESSGFAAMAFKSTRGDKKDVKPAVKDEFLFGTAGEIKLDPSQRRPVIIDVNTDPLAYENFDTDPEEKLDRWIQKLTNMRRKKLEGEALL